MHKKLKQVGLISLQLFFCIFCYAGSYNIAPTKLVLSSKHPIAILKITNEKKHSSVLQLSIKQWQQNQQKNFYTRNHDIIVTPPIFKLPANKTQIIRLAISRAPDPVIERAYRLYLQEVIPAIKPPKMMKKDQLKVALRISIPVFIEPLSPVQKKLNWFVTSKEKTIHVCLKNQGTKTLFISKIQLTNSENLPVADMKKLFVYILPGQSHSWVFTKSRQSPPKKIKYFINNQFATTSIH